MSAVPNGTNNLEHSNVRCCIQLTDMCDKLVRNETKSSNKVQALNMY
uniref:Uncharacterized protein n=1 Tax=Octopus bimaculoides TaxID=37653 RepID=A0A0L8H4W0_OCTBM